VWGLGEAEVRMILQDGPILSDRELKKLKEHKYSACCTTMLDPMMQKYWNWFVTLCPMWVAPNLITMVGLAINLATSALLVWYCPTATERPPWWTTLSAALGLFLYQTLDAIDGKQARRTGTACPLGELFDHGCDSLSTVAVTIGSCCALRIGIYPAWLLAQVIIGSSLFYCAHWQTYVSGTLQFGYIDVTEGQMVVMGVMLLTSLEDILCIDLWLSSLYFFSLNQVVTIFGVGCGLYSMFKTDGTVDKIFTGGAGKGGSTVAGTSVISPATPLFLTILAAFVIAYKSDEFIFHNQPIIYVLVFGLVAAKISNRLVVAHMCKGEISSRDASLLAPLALFLNQYFNTFISERPLLYLALVWVIIDLLWYCTKVCLEICNYLEVCLFTIPQVTHVQVASSSHNGTGTQTLQSGSSGSSGSSNSSNSSGPVTRHRKKHNKC